MKSEKVEQRAPQARKDKPIFKKVTTWSTAEIGITLRIGDDVLKKLEDIRKEEIKAALEQQKFVWR